MLYVNSQLYKIERSIVQCKDHILIFKSAPPHTSGVLTQLKIWNIEFFNIYSNNYNIKVNLKLLEYWHSLSVSSHYNWKKEKSCICVFIADTVDRED